MSLNRNQQALKDYVDRMCAIDAELEEAKEQAKEAKKDLLAEIKAKFDETGVNGKDVVRGAKLKRPKKSIAERKREIVEDEEYLASIGWRDDMLD